MEIHTILPRLFSFKYQPRETSECVKFRRLTDTSSSIREIMEMPTLTQFPDEIIFTKCPHCTDIVFQVFCLAKGHVPVVYFCAMLFSPTGQFCLCLNRNLGLEAGGPVVIQGAKKNGSFSYYPGYLLA